MRAFGKVYGRAKTVDELLSLVLALQDNARSAFDEIGLFPMLGGALLERVTLGTTPTKLDHGLGAKPRGVFPVSTTSGGSLPVWDTTRSFPEKHLWMSVASGAWQGDLWVWR